MALQSMRESIKWRKWIHLTEGLVNLLRSLVRCRLSSQVVMRRFILKFEDKSWRATASTRAYTGTGALEASIDAVFQFQRCTFWNEHHICQNMIGIVFRV